MNFIKLIIRYIEYRINVYWIYLLLKPINNRFQYKQIICYSATFEKQFTKEERERQILEIATC